jgi:hypothetical protein
MAAIDQVLINLASGVPRHRKKFLFALLGGLLAAYYYNRKNLKLQNECQSVERGEKSKESPKVGVNLAFIQKLKKIIPICIPGNLNKIVKSMKFLLFFKESLRKNLVY